MADSTYTTKVYMAQGGDTQVVASGGEINVESGGKITNDGTQAAHIVDVGATYTTGVQGKINAVLAALEGAGILATS